jgi:hypothetical protein
MGQNIKDRLIPLIDHLCHHIPLKLSTVFSEKLLLDTGLGKDINCHDLNASDAFFGVLRKK